MKKAILIVDDNVTMREVMTDILATIQATVFTAANGQEGLDILQQERQHIVLVLLDMDMPVMNGEQTYAMLQKIAPDVKVIVSTSLTQAEVHARLGNLERPLYLQKPFNVGMLLNTVQTQLTNSPSPEIIA